MLSNFKVIKAEWRIIIATVIAYIIPGIVTAVGSAVAWWIWLLITLGAVCTLYVRIQGYSRYRKWRKGIADKTRAQNRAIAEREIKAILRIVINAVPGKIPARANVMLIDEKEQLYIAYQEGMDSAEDLTLRWEKYVGSCGDAWGSGKQRIADLDSIDETTLEITWKMDAEHRARTSKVKSIISTPIRDIDNRDILIGVLNCDSSETLSRSRLNEEAFRTTMVKYVEIIVGFLRLGRIIKEEGDDGGEGI